MDPHLCGAVGEEKQKEIGTEQDDIEHARAPTSTRALDEIIVQS